MNMKATRTAADPGLLGIYLNDHLAGASGGVELARRIARSQRGTEAGGRLDGLAAEIAEDRAELIGIMAALEVPVRHYKVYAGRLAEKAGRVKPNGRLLRRSPLSSVIELEGLKLGVEGKLAGWHTLRMLAGHDQRLDADRLDGLIATARAQADLLEELRTQASAEMLGLT